MLTPPAAIGTLNGLFQRFTVCQHRHEDFIFWKRRDIEFMPPGYKDIYPGRLFLSRRQAEVDASAKSFSACRHIQTKNAANPRVHAIRCHHQPGAPRFPLHHQADNISILHKRLVYAGTAMGCDPGRFCGRLEKDLVQEFSTLTPPGNPQAVRFRKPSLGRLISKMVPDPVEWDAASGIC